MTRILNAYMNGVAMGVDENTAVKESPITFEVEWDTTVGEVGTGRTFGVGCSIWDKHKTQRLIDVPLKKVYVDPAKLLETMIPGIGHPIKTTLPTIYTDLQPEDYLVEFVIWGTPGEPPQDRLATAWYPLTVIGEPTLPTIPGAPPMKAVPSPPAPDLFGVIQKNWQVVAVGLALGTVIAMSRW